MRPSRVDFASFDVKRSGNVRTSNSAIALQNAFASSQARVGSIGTTTCRPLPPVVFRKRSSSSVSSSLRSTVTASTSLSQPSASSGSKSKIEPVGMAELRRARAPRMHLEHAHLQQRDDRADAVRHHVRLLAAAFADVDPLDVLGKRLLRVLLVEARLVPAVRAAHERQRTAARAAARSSRRPLRNTRRGRAW